MQHFLKAFARSARAWVVAAELFQKLLVAVNDPQPTLHMGLGRIAPAALTGALESTADRSLPDAWDTSEKSWKPDYGRARLRPSRIVRRRAIRLGKSVALRFNPTYDCPRPRVHIDDTGNGSNPRCSDNRAGRLPRDHTHAVEMVAAAQTISTVNSSTSNAPSPLQLKWKIPHEKITASAPQMAVVAIVLAVVSCMVHLNG